jgi:hypothetical protein
MADIVSEEIGRPVRYQYVSKDEWSSQIGGLVPDATVEHLTSMLEICANGITILRKDYEPNRSPTHHDNAQVVATSLRRRRQLLGVSQAGGPPHHLLTAHLNRRTFTGKKDGTCTSMHGRTKGESHETTLQQQGRGD